MENFTNYFITVLGENQKTKEAIRLVPIFTASSPSLLDLIFQYGKIVSLQPGETLIKEGDFDQWIYITLQGSLLVYVQNRQISKIGGLVGERCLLGEARSATLKAAGEVYVFGVDMSMLNRLSAPDLDKKLVLAFVELLSLITDQVLQRLLDLWFNFAFLKKYGKKNLEHVGEKQILEALFSGDLAQHPQIISFLWLLMQKEQPDLCSAYWDPEKQTIDTRKLAIDLTTNNQVHVLLNWAQEVFYWCQRNQIIPISVPIDQPDIAFCELIQPFLNITKKELTDPMVLKEFEARQATFYQLDGRGHITLNPIREFLVEKGMTDKKMIEVFFTFLKRALDLNQEINHKIRELSQTHYLGAFLESEYFTDEKLFIHSATSNRLTKHDRLYSDLINPYNEMLQQKLKSFSAATAGKKSVPSEKKPDAQQPDQAAADDPSNFENLLKQLGATPGVPLD